MDYERLNAEARRLYVGAKADGAREARDSAEHEYACMKALDTLAIAEQIARVASDMPRETESEQSAQRAVVRLVGVALTKVPAAPAGAKLHVAIMAVGRACQPVPFAPINMAALNDALAAIVESRQAVEEYARVFGS